MRLLDRLLRRLVRHGSLAVTDAGGREHRYGEPDAADPVHIRLTDRTTARHIALDPPLGAAEAWMDGRLIVENGEIGDLLRLIGRNTSLSINPSSRSAWRMRTLAAAWSQFNHPRRSRRNVAHHYDLSDRLYDLFLDADRQYSCAYFRDGVDDLGTAQADKKAHIAAKLALSPGQQVLDIGCGWGGMALYLARVANVEVTGITLSKEQCKVAEARAAAAGMSERVRFRLIDYRQLEGRFDRIVSVGMFEHVGKPHYRTFFDRVRELLDADGVALLHTIGRVDGPGGTDSFTRKYIFPGGYSPALSEIVPAIERARLWIADVEVLRLHYAKTLDAWLERTRAARAEIEEIYDERFYRMWVFYLASSRGAFVHGSHVNFQIQLTRRRDALPLTRDYMAEAEARYRQSEAASPPVKGSDMSAPARMSSA